MTETTLELAAHTLPFRARLTDEAQENALSTMEFSPCSPGWIPAPCFEGSAPDRSAESPRRSFSVGFETPDVTLAPNQVRTASGSALEILGALRAHPISTRQERLVRLIGSTYYRDGYCYAAHETLAGKMGCAKSTVQSDLDELEARGLIQVTRRHGTSNITLLADGLIEALRLWRIGRRARRQRNRGIPRIAGTFTTPLPSVNVVRGTIAPNVSLCKDVEEEEPFVSVSCDEQVKVSIGSFASDAVLDEDEPFAPIAEENHFQISQMQSEQMPVVQGFSDENRPKEATPPKTRDPYISLTISSQDDETFFQRKTGGASAAALVTEGVTPQRARGFASVFEPERIKRNIDLGIHRSKNNPPGYLLYLIQHDIAARQSPRPQDSRSHAHEQKFTPPSRLSVRPTHAVIAQNACPEPMKQAISPGVSADMEYQDSAQRFAALAPEERASYTARATEEVRRRLLPIVGSFNPHSPATQAMIHSRILYELREAYTTSTNTS